MAEKADLLAQITEDIETATRLRELIQQERRTLEQRDLAPLEQILADKQPLIGLLAEHGRQRSASLKQQALPDTAESLEMLAGAEGAPQIKVLEQLLADCRKHNEHNGRLIHISKTATERMLGIVLHGSVGNDTVKIYNKSGNTTKMGWQKPLSTA